MTSRERLVVIGNGMAGARFVEEVVARGGSDRFDITVFGEEPYGNYNRILLSSVLANTHDPEDIFLNPVSWYEQHGVSLLIGVRAGWIDRLARKVLAPGGVVVPYDRLVLATGSTPFVPPLDGVYTEEGTLKEGAFAFRTLADCDGIIQRVSGSRTAAVIGGGLLGLEAARGLMARGLEVHLVHLMADLMETQLDPAGAAILRSTLERMGLQIHLEKATTGIRSAEAVEGLSFSDGSTLACDLVVISAGIRPNTDLARQAGLAVQRGIVVHDDLSCRNSEDIYAIGECIQHRGVTYGLVAPVWDQARVLADRMASGSQAVYTGSRVSTKLKVMGVDLAVMGEKEAAADTDEVVTYVEPVSGVYKKLVVRDGRLVGAIVMGDGDAVPAVVQAFDRGALLPERRAELLFALDGQTGYPDVADLPDDAQVCDCNGVSKGRIIAAVKQGARTMKAVCNATRAGTGCGACKPQVQSLLELAADGLVAEDPSIHYYVPGVALPKADLVQAIRERGLRGVSAVFSALADGREDVASKPGLASLLKTIWGSEYEDERDARFINDRVHANIQNDGTFSVVPRIYGGVTTPDQLRRIADVADKHGVPMIKITGAQRIDLLGIPKEKLPAVWTDLDMASGHAYTKAFRTCKTCVGTDFCRYGLGDSTGLGISIEKRFQGIEAPHKIKAATAGCPRNCSEATTKDLGTVAIDGGRWEVYVGGAAGSRVRKGDVLCVVDSHDEVVTYMGRFTQYYREHARYQERTPGFVERIGIQTLRQVLVEDSQGICARLDAEIERTVEAYVDPWEEALSPDHPTQFAGALVADEK